MAQVSECCKYILLFGLGSKMERQHAEEGPVDGRTIVMKSFLGSWKLDGCYEFDQLEAPLFA